MDKLVEALDDAIKHLMEDPASWKDKVAAIKKGVDEGHLDEFLSWFDEQDDEDEAVPAKA